MKKTIIKRISPGKLDPFVEAHIAEITGKQTYTETVFYSNLETGDEYSWLSAGLAWPSSGMPGYAAIIAVTRVQNKEPSFVILDEVEDSSILSFLQKCIDLRDKYMNHECYHFFRSWYGDHENFQTFMIEINRKLRAKPDALPGFYLVPPYDFDKPNRFEIYLHRLQECLIDIDGTGKKLSIGKKEIFRNRLQNLPQDALRHGTIEQYPCVSCVGFIVHTLMASKPWERVMPYSFDESKNYSAWDSDIFEQCDL